MTLVLLTGLLLLGGPVGWLVTLRHVEQARRECRREIARAQEEYSGHLASVVAVQVGIKRRQDALVAEAGVLNQHIDRLHRVVGEELDLHVLRVGRLQMSAQQLLAELEALEEPHGSAPE